MSLLVIYDFEGNINTRIFDKYLAKHEENTKMGNEFEYQRMIYFNVGNKFKKSIHLDKFRFFSQNFISLELRSGNRSPTISSWISWVTISTHFAKVMLQNSVQNSYIVTLFSWHANAVCLWYYMSVDTEMKKPALWSKQFFTVLRPTRSRIMITYQWRYTDRHVDICSCHQSSFSVENGVKDNNRFKISLGLSMRIMALLQYFRRYKFEQMVKKFKS